MKRKEIMLIYSSILKPLMSERFYLFNHFGRRYKNHAKLWTIRNHR